MGKNFDNIIEMSKFKEKVVGLDDIFFDPNNPRFFNKERLTPDSRIIEEGIQRSCLQKMQEFDIRELKDSIARVGFLPIDRIVVRAIPNADDKYVVVEGNLVYCEVPNMADAANNGFPNDGTVFKGMLPIGIGTADEYYGGDHTNYLHDIIIRNNIVVNCRRGYNHYPQYTGSGMINISILNNTIITPDTVVPGTVSVGDADNFLGISLSQRMIT